MAVADVFLTIFIIVLCILLSIGLFGIYVIVYKTKRTSTINTGSVSFENPIYNIENPEQDV